ncbi:MAG: DUF4760 domain-containing protein [Gemmatimonadota bacterium]
MLTAHSIHTPVPKDYADHHDAELVIQLYDLRREATMRASRGAINGQFWPKNSDETMAVTKSDHPLNAAWRQTTTYWEMVYSMARHGIINPEFLLESTGEGVYLFAKVEKYLQQLREQNPKALRNVEWITGNSEAGKDLLEHYRKRVASTLTGK